MSEKQITIAIHTSGKAKILSHYLEQRGIKVTLKEIKAPSTGRNTSPAYYVRINEADLQKALTAIEEKKLFNYADEKTYTVDDGRKRILVAVDFSDYSLKACQIAFNIAKEIDAKVKLLHVYNTVLHFPSTLPFAETFKDESDVSILDRIRKQMLSLCLEIDRKITNGELPSVNYSYSLREGTVEEEINAFVHEYKPVLLVVGTKGKSNSNTRIVGNVTADIIEITNVPVIAVPENSPIERLSDIRHIVFLTNLQERDKKSFSFLVKLIKSYKEARITLLHLNLINKKGDKWTEEQLAGMKKEFEEQYPDLNVEYKLVDSPNMEETINCFIEEEKVNIVALNSRKRNIFGRMFRPSVPRKILSDSGALLLILRG